MKTLVLIAFLSFFAVGCSIEVSNTDLKKAPSISNPFPLGIKYSGGGNEASGTTVDADLSIGLKDRQIKGTTVDAQMSISTNRPSL